MYFLIKYGTGKKSLSYCVSVPDTDTIWQGISYCFKEGRIRDMPDKRCIQDFDLVKDYIVYETVKNLVSIEEISFLT